MCAVTFVFMIIGWWFYEGSGGTADTSFRRGNSIILGIHVILVIAGLSGEHGTESECLGIMGFTTLVMGGLYLFHELEMQATRKQLESLKAYDIAQGWSTDQSEKNDSDKGKTG